jgi:hypothetical protein
MVRFQLEGASWRKLETALKQTELHALAGDYGPATRRAEESTWVIVVGHDTVRITASAMPSKLRAGMEPLLKALDEVISVGMRDMPRSCAGKQTAESARRTIQTAHGSGWETRSNG